MKGIIKIFILFGILSIIVLPCFSQDSFTSSQKRQYNYATKYLNSTNYVQALSIYEELFVVDSSHAELNYYIGMCKLKTGAGKKKALLHFEKASNQNITNAHYYRAVCLHNSLLFDESLEYLEKYKSVPEKDRTFANWIVERQISIVKAAKEMYNDPIVAEIKNMGVNINSEYHDYSPRVSADKSKLIFTSRRAGSTGDEKDPQGKYFEDIYTSHKENGEWTAPVRCGPNINTNTHDASVGLSADGQTLIIYRTSKDMISGDLYMSTLEGDEWQKPVKLDDHVNSPYKEVSACLSANGNIMYFSSDRPGGQGGKDLYKVMKFFNGEWSNPQNLGPTINTPYDEDAPFIHPDEKSMYFSSKGHNTMGGYDIFQSELLEGGTWTKPHNLGYPINSVNHDSYFVVSADWERGYYSSNKKDSYGGQDLYTVSMDFKEGHISLTKGRVLSGKDNTPVKAKLTVIDDITGTTYGIYRSNAKTGNYLITLKPGRSYKLMVDCNGFETLIEHIQLEKEGGYVEKHKDIVLIPK